MEKITPAKFTNFYVEAALSILRKEGRIPLNVFYEEVHSKLFEKINASEEDLRYLDHAFHWAFFSRDYSPFTTLSEKRDGESITIITSRKPKEPLPDKSYLVKAILEKDGEWLGVRLRDRIDLSNSNTLLSRA
jgi:hypothetical protein